MKEEISVLERKSFLLQLLGKGRIRVLLSGRNAYASEESLFAAGLLVVKSVNGVWSVVGGW